MNWPKSVIIKEVGPRDGLQNEKLFISTEDKISWINHLSITGLSYIEVTSFVHPNWIPALADAIAVTKGIDRQKDVTYAALVPNMKGLERALMANIDEVAVFMSTSETHNKQNRNQTIEETYPIVKQVIQESLSAGKTVRAYLSTVFGCPFEGEISIKSILNVIEKLIEMGVNELSIGDTIGVANPRQVQEVVRALLYRFPSDIFAMHFHNTRGTALANVIASLDMGISKYDSSVGGLGGCPYAPGSSGNLATEDLLYMVDGMGISTGVSKEKIHQAGLFIQEKIGRELDSHNLQANKGNPDF